MSRPDIVDKSKASSHPLRPGRFYTARVKKVHTDGKISVFVQELGLNIGPVTPIGLTDVNTYSVDDYVKCTFSDEFFNELIIFGNVVKKENIFALKTELGGYWTETTPVINQGSSLAVTNTVSYSKYSSIGLTRIWNCNTIINSSGESGQPIVVVLPEICPLPSRSVVGSATILRGGSTYYSCITVISPSFLTDNSVTFMYAASPTDSFIGETPAYALASDDIISFSISYEVLE
jgi:hypothetical protein